MSSNRHKKFDCKEFSLWAQKLLRNGKKTCQALESLNSEVQDKSYLEITMLGHDEPETDTKNRTSTNSSSELTNPL